MISVRHSAKFDLCFAWYTQSIYLSHIQNLCGENGTSVSMHGCRTNHPFRSQDEGYAKQSFLRMKYISVCIRLSSRIGYQYLQFS